MTPGARTQATIELIDSILTSWQSEKRFPADKQLEIYFKSHRYIGSGDRQAIGELTYWILRHMASLSWWLRKRRLLIEARPLVFAALLLRKEYDARSIISLTRDSKYSPDALSSEEDAMCQALSGQPLDHADMPRDVRLNYPEWIEPLLEESFGERIEEAAAAMNTQAPTDLRVNTLKITREKLMKQLKNEGFDVAPTPHSLLGLRLAKRAPIFTSKYFKEGYFEVQDEGSQLVAQLVDAKPTHKVIDFCAGAGGKTLAIAAAMENKGRILAWDTSEKRLGQTTARFRRAGVHNVQTHVLTSQTDPFLKRHLATADRVLVDAPCSGSGTWRRNPDLKWRFTQQDMDEMTALQQSILASAARLVKPGGRLIYATCSLFKNENDRQVEQFLKTSNTFRVVCAQKIWDKTAPEGESAMPSYLWVTPHQDGVDGFFAAALERLAE